MTQITKLDKNNDRATTEITSLSHDGRGIATINNKKAFINGALPNETVTYNITRKRSSYYEAEVDEILVAAPERAKPPCMHFGLCGGCSLQHMSLDLQLTFKQNTLLDQLKRFGNVEPQQILAPLNAKTQGYRRKARLGAKFVIKKEKLLVGFRERASRYLADLSECEVLETQVGKHFNDLRELIYSLSIYQHIPQVEVAIGDHQVALVFRHLEPMTSEDENKLIAFGQRFHFHIYLQPNSPQPIHQVWPLEKPERLTYTLPDYQLEFLFHPLDFTQINLELNRSMVKQAIELLDLNENDTVLDLFCGIGNFTLPIAKHAKLVTGIEGSEEMVTRAKTNATHNKLDNVEFYVTNLMEPERSSSEWINRSYDKILLDPPRAGAKEILPYLAKIAAKKIVYISCNPATLARDAGELVHLYGYRLCQTGMMNMFPHTSHIEAMAVFERG